MGNDLETIIDKVLNDLNDLVKAKTEEAVRSLHKEIENSIKETGYELRKKFKLKNDAIVKSPKPNKCPH